MLQRSLFRAGRKGGYVNIRFGRRRDRAHIWGNRKEEVVEAFTGMEVTQVNARCLLRGEIKKKKKRIKAVRFQGVCWGLLLSFLSHSLKPHSAFPSNSSILSFLLP